MPMSFRSSFVSRRVIATRASLAFVLASGALLSACGGGSGDDEDTTPPVALGPEVAATSSYRNRVDAGFEPMEFPVGLAAYNPYAWGDFAGQGRLDFFSTRLTYDISKPAAEATPAVYAFWRRAADGSVGEAPEMLEAGGAAPCVHPRYARVADLNGDGRVDVFVACHGYDAAPFAGERNQVVLSQPGGTYRVADAGADVGFFHGAALFDFDADGAPDAVVVDGTSDTPVFVLRNDGSGHFTRDDRYRMPSALGGKSYFSVEVLDVDGDGRSDVVVGGHEWERDSRTRVLINRGDNQFASVTPIDVPAVAGYGVVLDYLVTVDDGVRSLWLLRAGGETGNQNFYVGTAVQRIDVETRQSTTPLADRSVPWSQFFVAADVDGIPVVTTPQLPAPFTIAR